MTLCVRTRTSHSRCSFEPMEAPKEWSGPAPLHWLQPGQPCGPRPLAAFPRLPAGAGSPIKHFKPCSAHRATRPAAPALTSPLSGTGRAVEQGCAPGVGPWSGTPTARPLRWPAPQCTLPGAPSLPRRPKPRAPLQVVLLKTGEVAGATYDATTAVVRATSRQVALRPDPPPACRPASTRLCGVHPPVHPICQIWRCFLSGFVGQAARIAGGTLCVTAAGGRSAVSVPRPSRVPPALLPARAAPSAPPRRGRQRRLAARRPRGRAGAASVARSEAQPAWHCARARRRGA